ncbi:MAG: AAC(3) family N-acetyltransferase [Anaerolineae bacterium]
MQPEKGDPNIQVTAADVAAAARSLGLAAGDTVMFHSSLSSMGTVAGGADAVIDGMLQAVGPEGTVVVPTLCNWEPGEQAQVFPRWDPVRSPSYVGRITEVFRQRPEARRSDHATHSVAAIGRRAEELTAGHGSGGERLGPFGPRAFARASPWQRLIDWDAHYCFIGVTYRVNTMVHMVESLLVEHALERAPSDRRPSLAAAITDWLVPGIWPTVRIDDREAIEALLAERGLVRCGSIGSATLRCSPAGQMVRTWVEIIEADPQRWLPADYLAWLALTG